MNVHGHLGFGLITCGLLAFAAGSCGGVQGTGGGPQAAGALDAAAAFTITRPLQVSLGVVGDGQTLTGLVSYTNTGSSAITVDQIVIAARAPGATHAGGPYTDLLPSLASTTIAAGATVTVRANRTFSSADVAGVWEVYPTFALAGVPHDGSGLTVTVARIGVPTTPVTPAPPVTSGSPPRTGPALGVVLNWVNPYDPDLIFADAARHGAWLPISGNSLELGADGWPVGPSQLSVLLDDNNSLGAVAGDYHGSFTGQSTVTPVNGGGAVSNLVYDPGTSTTTFVSTVRENDNVTFQFGSAIKNFKLMRPGLPVDVGTASTRFNPAWLQAVSYGSVLRCLAMCGPGLEIAAGSSLNGVNGNYDVYWSFADAVADGVPAWQPNRAYAYGALVTNRSHVYRARLAGTSASSGSGPVGGGNWGDGAEVIDGGVHWTLANRIRPSETAYAFHGVPWEDLILLANARGKAIWLNLPYFANDNYMRKLARLFRYGSDANGEPYSSAQSNPVWPPLNPGIAVYLEHANELWNWSYGLTQEASDSMNANLSAGDVHQINFNTPASNQWSGLWRDAMFYAVRNSLLWREVWGDAGMMTVVRPVYAGQLDYGMGGATGSAGQASPSNQATAIFQALQYVKDTWGSAGPATVAGLTNPRRPVSYYLFGIAPAPYLDNIDNVDLNNGGNVDALFTMLNRGLGLRKPQIDYWKHSAAANGIKFLCYEWGTEVGAHFAAATSAAWSDPRLRTLLHGMGDYLWNASPPGGYTYDKSVIDVMNITNSIGDGTFGVLQHVDDPRTGPRWQAMQDLAAELP
jgi:hypothetical protein